MPTPIPPSPSTRMTQQQSPEPTQTLVLCDKSCSPFHKLPALSPALSSFSRIIPLLYLTIVQGRRSTPSHSASVLALAELWCNVEAPLSCTDSMLSTGRNWHSRTSTNILTGRCPSLVPLIYNTNNVMKRMYTVIMLYVLILGRGPSLVPLIYNTNLAHRASSLSCICIRYVWEAPYPGAGPVTPAWSKTPASVGQGATEVMDAAHREHNVLGNDYQYPDYAR